MNDVKAYAIYLSMKLHFNQQSYNIEKYGFTPKKFSCPETLRKRNDAYFFTRLAKMHPEEQDLITFLASNFIYDSDCWIGDLVHSESAMDNFFRMKSVLKSIDHYVIEDAKQMFSETGSFRKLLYIQNDLPYTITEALKRRINPETVIILERIFHFLNKTDRSLGEDHIVWSEVRHRFFKFSYFVSVKDIETLRYIHDELKNMVISARKH